MALLAWLVTIVPAMAAPVGLYTETGVPKNEFAMPLRDPCDPRAQNRADPARRLLDDIDRPLIAAGHGPSGCILTQVSPAGFFEADPEPATTADIPEPVLRSVITAACVLGAMLCLGGLGFHRYRRLRHRSPRSRRRPGSRRNMAFI